MSEHRDGFGSTPRLAIAMWDFSWLTRRSGAEAEYADWPRVLDGLAERGYDCVRIDAFPHLVAATESSTGRDGGVTILPERYAAGWGNSAPVQVEPRACLASFMSAARDRGLKVGLSTWLTPDSSGQRALVRTPADFARIWGKTLAFLDAEGLLDCVAWVDLCNEFPYGGWGGGWYPDLFGMREPLNAVQTLAPYVRRWGRSRQDALAAFMADSIAPLRSRWPQLDYTFSWMPVRAGVMRGLDSAALDLAEVHVWLSDNPAFGLPTASVLATVGVPGAVKVLARIGPWLWRRDRSRWRAALGHTMDTWAQWARARNLALYTTEAWAVTVFADISPGGRSGEWDWVREICLDGVSMAVEKGWTGICTSNFCQPHFAGMWADPAWHRDLTDLIHRP